MAASSIRRGFPYFPLADTDIRILRIKPGADDRVICYLHHATLNDTLYYDVLSYVWGDTSIKQEIRVNGLSFWVTENLYTALKRLRSIPPPDGCAVASLWVDAICINQDDASEKSRQVPQMNRIYTNASRVFVWISPAELNRDPSLREATNRVRELFRPDTTQWWQQELTALRNSTMSMEESAVAVRKGVFSSLIYFQQHPWFHRIWTLQESVLARRSPILLFDDDDAFDESCEVFTLDALHEKVVWSPPCVQIIAKLMELRKWVQRPGLLAKMSMHNPGYMLLLVLCRSELRTVSIPQDRLYGLYGIFSAVCGQFPGLTFPQIDYTLPHHQVFGQFARYIIETTGSTCLLDCAVYNWRYLRGPTWVSMFSSMPKAFLKTAPTNPFHRPIISADGLMLTIKGVLKDRCVVALRRSDPRDHHQVAEYVMEIEDKVVKPVALQRGLDPKTVREALFRVSHTYETYEYYRQHPGNESEDEQSSTLVGEDGGALWQITSPIFVTSQGFFGLCHTMGPCSVGDYICLRPKGAPLILRKQDGSEMYEVIGPVSDCLEDLRDRAGLEFEDVCLV
ncbi:heterokaryon incompatibility protein [Colletotrichum chrysophilum]|uniref:Heterokaryon incompatibility protein n=1 Tax=Colletotrichum chrysophilum TaxID=1836956 RepID=A0AAD9EH88_9PEZI|nr:heterokaryon incompatibility protein [Colletotrichum chrysophilum]